MGHILIHCLSENSNLTEHTVFLLNLTGHPLGQPFTSSYIYLLWQQAQNPCQSSSELHLVSLLLGASLMLMCAIHVHWHGYKLGKARELPPTGQRLTSGG